MPKSPTTEPNFTHPQSTQSVPKLTQKFPKHPPGPLQNLQNLYKTSFCAQNPYFYSVFEFCRGQIAPTQPLQNLYKTTTKPLQNLYKTSTKPHGLNSTKLKKHYKNYGLVRKRGFVEVVLPKRGFRRGFVVVYGGHLGDFWVDLGGHFGKFWVHFASFEDEIRSCGLKEIELHQL